VWVRVCEYVCGWLAPVAGTAAEQKEKRGEAGGACSYTLHSYMATGDKDEQTDVTYERALSFIPSPFPSSSRCSNSSSSRRSSSRRSSSRITITTTHHHPFHAQIPARGPASNDEKRKGGGELGSCNDSLQSLSLFLSFLAAPAALAS